MRVTVAVVFVWLIVFAVPFVIYGAASTVLDLKPPGGAPWRFLASVAVTKLGTAVAFVAIFVATRPQWRGYWPVYAAIWFLMFGASELGDYLKPRSGYSGTEALLGVLSEAVYAPLSAFTLDRLFR